MSLHFGFSVKDVNQWCADVSANGCFRAKLQFQIEIMKKQFIYILAFAAVFSFTPNLSQAKPPIKAPMSLTDEVAAKALVDRLEEIKAMDRSELSSVEKKALRQETKSIKKELKAMGGGVYVSAGAVIIILLLLILLF